MRLAQIRRWLQRLRELARPIRVRIAAASTAATLVLLFAAGLIFLTTLRSGLQHSLDTSLSSSVAELQTQITGAGALDPSRRELTLADDNVYGQVITAGGSVSLSTSPRLNRTLVPAGQLTKLFAGQHDARFTLARPGLIHHAKLRVLAVGLADHQGVVAVAISRDVVDEAIERAGKQLLVVGAIVLLLVGPGSWLLAGAALRPVERMRTQAARLQTQDAAGGLSVPPVNDEIARLAVTLNELLARLHEALERERAFVADAGHELRTPLTVLRGELELARRPGRSREELLETVQVASVETERLIRLSEDLLVLAREDQSGRAHRSPFDLAAVVDDSRAMLTGLAATSGVDIVVESADSLPVSGDPDRIRRAVDNVLTNAVRFAPSGSPVTVQAHIEDGWATVVVLDTGPGFPPELLTDAFERFRQGDQVRTRDDVGHAGFGLGLAIVQRILRSHGGEATVANRPDAPGAQVVLRWPVEAGPRQTRLHRADGGRSAGRW